MTPLEAMLKANIDTYAEGATAGITAERKHWIDDVLQPIFTAYRRALADPKVVIPTTLHAALANAQREVGAIREAQAAAKKADHENAYAEAMIRKDKRERYEGRDDGSQDLDLVGRMRQAGA